MSFFFLDPASAGIYTLSLHDALPILRRGLHVYCAVPACFSLEEAEKLRALKEKRSEEHTSELQSRQYLVCRLLLEKKNNIQHPPTLRHIAQKYTPHGWCLVTLYRSIR